jgi:hypothetical protein
MTAENIFDNRSNVFSACRLIYIKTPFCLCQFGLQLHISTIIYKGQAFNHTSFQLFALGISPKSQLFAVGFICRHRIMRLIAQIVRAFL